AAVRGVAPAIFSSPHGAADPHDLHSFPTRRSSDLIDALKDGDAPRLGHLMKQAQGFFDRYAPGACPEELAAPVLHKVLAYEPIQIGRDTSELQSRENLVCRLLLEKKKTHNETHGRE